MTKFGITKTTKKTWKDYLSNINSVFLILLVLCFSFFLFYSRLTNMLFADDKLDIFKEDLGKIAIYFQPIDKEFSRFLVILDEVIKSYNN